MLRGLIVAGKVIGGEICGLFVVKRRPRRVDAAGGPHRIERIRRDQFVLLEYFRHVLHEPIFRVRGQFAAAFAARCEFRRDVREMLFDPFMVTVRDLPRMTADPRDQ